MMSLMSTSLSTTSYLWEKPGENSTPCHGLAPGFKLETQDWIHGTRNMKFDYKKSNLLGKAALINASCMNARWGKPNKLLGWKNAGNKRRAATKRAPSCSRKPTEFCTDSDQDRHLRQ